MKRFRQLTILAIAFLALAASGYGLAWHDASKNPDPKTSQAAFAAIVVNGRALTGPNSSARTSGRIVVPIDAIARALGDTLVVNATARSVTVSRSGVTAFLDAALGHVSENGAVILTVSNSREIPFTPNADEMMLPVEIAATLLGASIRFDVAQNKVIIIRGASSSRVVEDNKGRGLIELYDARYEYNLSRYSSSIGQNLVLSGTGRLGDGRFFLTSNSSGATLRQFTPRNFSFDLQRPNGQRFLAGDFGSGGSLPLLTANVRGGLASLPVGDITIAAFGGKADSGMARLITAGDLTTFARPRFDTNVFGIYATRAGGRTEPFTLSVGAMRFSGRPRSGTLASSSLNYAGSRLRLQADLGVGNFRGLTYDGLRIGGSDIAMDLGATYHVAENLSVQGRYAHVGTNFISPQSGVREPIDLKAAGVTWSPLKWLSASTPAPLNGRPRPDDLTALFQLLLASRRVLANHGYISHIPKAVQKRSGPAHLPL